MGRKLPFTSLFSKPNTTINDTTPSSSSSSSSSSTSSISSSWAWPSCSNNPRTDSLRFNPNHLYKTINSVFFDSDDAFFSASLRPMSIQEEEEEEEEESESESIIRSLVKKTSSSSSDRRLIVEPAGSTSSLVHDDDHVAAAAVAAAPAPFKQSVAMAMESQDPYGDFRRSMEEMVAAHGMTRDWEWLEELLVWYLRVNGKKNHGFIVGAFVDLLVDLAAAAAVNGPNGSATTTSSCADDSSENYGDHEKDVSVTTPSNSNCSTMSCVSFEIEEVLDR